jgi:hypothetical protein
MSIAYDSSAASANFTVATATTYSHTCGSNNAILLVAVSSVSGTLASAAVTYNGVSMTLWDTSINNFKIWILVNPSRGTFNVSVTTGFVGIHQSCSVSYKGIGTESEPATINYTNNTASNTITLSNTDVYYPRMWMVSFGVMSETVAGLTISMGKTSRQNVAFGSNKARLAIEDSNGAILLWTAATGYAQYSVTLTSNATSANVGFSAVAVVGIHQSTGEFFQFF